MVFKNASSSDRKRRILCATIINKKDNLLTRTERKYTYIIKKLDRLDGGISSSTQIFIHNEENTFKPSRKYTYLIKGSLLVNTRVGAFLIKFSHSLQIEINPVRDAV